ncbi:MAG: acyl-CoA thioesterase [Spirochaetaceae bacterium]|nr:MAG: acyl-CoA thioesterase [Spirochaetaceae bacterium]
MTNKHVETEVLIRAEFYDVDSMKVVWHGNYMKFMEIARCALLEKIGYSYHEMDAEGTAWPVVTVQMKYKRPVFLGQTFAIKATLLEYENRIKISYRMYDPKTGEIFNKSESVQMGVDIATGQTLFVSPKSLVAKVETLLAGNAKKEKP